MEYRYLLDTNIVSNLVKDPHGIVARQIKAIGEETVCTSIVVACELRFGAVRKGSERLTTQLEIVLAALDVLPLEAPIDQHYAFIRTHLEQSGQPIGANDLIIAAHARVHNLTLITANIREFSRVPELAVENWLVDV
jgi:tRNA(fMet)-specific endonuclease VapC